MTVYDNEQSIHATDDGDIFVEQDGPHGASALLLIHGSALSTRSWNAVVRLLAEKHRVIRVDLLGHGRSAKPETGDYSTPAQARRIAEILDELGVEHAIAIGHSSGGYTAAALAEQRPELVTAVALINTGPHLDALIEAGSATISPEQWPPTDEQTRHMADNGFAEGFVIPSELLGEIQLMTLGSLTATMRSATEYLQQLALPARLAAVGKPLLVIFGEADRRWDPSRAADYRAVPGARIELLPDVGHSPPIEAPIPTAARLLEFGADHIGAV